MAEQAISLDLKVYKSLGTNTVNIFANRAGYISSSAYVSNHTFQLAENTAFSLENKILRSHAFVIYSMLPIDIECQVDDNLGRTLFRDQTMFVLSSNVSDVILANYNSQTVQVTLIYLAELDTERRVMIPLQKIQFAALSRVSTALPQPVTNINNVRVRDVTLNPWTYNQNVLPGTGEPVRDLFRVCDEDGTPNVNGQHIMILDDNISQQNLSGALELWIEETT